MKRVTDTVYRSLLRQTADFREDSAVTMHAPKRHQGATSRHILIFLEKQAHASLNFFAGMGLRHSGNRVEIETAFRF